MARTLVVHDGTSTVVNFDDPRRKGDVFQSLVMAQLVDELTAEPIDRPIQIEHDVPHARPKSAAFGVCGVVGVPRQSFPNLAVQPYAIALRFEVAGYEPVDIGHTFAADPSFPDTFADANLLQIGLRRTPIVLTGRTVALDAQNRPQPVPGTQVRVTGIWRTVPDIDPVAGPALGAQFLSLTPALAADRSAGDLTIATLTPAGAPTALAVSAAPGATLIDVQTPAGIVAGDVVRIGGFDPERVEHVAVAQVLARNDVSSPGQLRLAHPLQTGHSGGEAVEVVTVAGAGPDASLTEAARAGDRLVFVNTTAPFGGALAVRVSTPGVDDEYLTASTLSTTSDAEGFYRLPRLSRIAAIQVSATAGPLSAVAAHTPNYGLFSNGLDLTMS